MKRSTIILTIIFLAFAIVSCKSKKEQNLPDEVESILEEIEDLPQGTADPKKVFSIEQGYVKYRNLAAGQEMTREWWFDDYGKKQFEDNFMTIMGQKAGGYTLVLDGFRYTWSYDESEGSKMKFYSSAATDYENISAKDKERYGIEKHGYEEVAGKRCLKVTVEKPMKATVWVWESIPLKTVSSFGGQEVIMEAIEISTSTESSKFELPAGVNFVES
ncbi:MAG: hypothetical protein JXR22_08660 [Prolixibacteraceae bacterium]|nr:hypothetical protein [Prolixibacteraceae bacterium]